jgi:Ca2+-binding EF-hand superfamily protein
LIDELFNALDKNRMGRVDFHDLVCGLSILQYGSLEERLKLAFLAYDTNHAQAIDKKDFFILLKSSLEANNRRPMNQEINQTVECTCSI